MLKTLLGVMKVQEPLLKKIAAASSMKHWGKVTRATEMESAAVCFEKRGQGNQPKTVHYCCICSQLTLSKKQHRGVMEKCRACF